MKQLRDPRILGWLAVAVSTIVTCLWAFWGIAENFHEGWYYESLLSNLGLMLAQYLSPMLLFMGVTVVSLLWPRLGACLHLALALLVVWFFRAAANAIAFVLMVPLVGLGALYWYGRPQPRRLALAVAIGLPLVTLGISGVAPAVRVSQRFDDGNLGARLVEGNGVALVWAPEGPGWPRAGMDWHQARRACQYLSDDGLTLAPEPQLLGPLLVPVERSLRSFQANPEAVLRTRRDL